MYEGKNNEIRRVMRKFSLRVNRLQRVRYGPYTIGRVPEPNDLTEVPMTSSLKRIMLQYYNDRTKQASSALREQESQMVIDKTKKAFKESNRRRKMASLDDFVANDSPLGMSMLPHSSSRSASKDADPQTDE